MPRSEAFRFQEKYLMTIDSKVALIWIAAGVMGLFSLNSAHAEDAKQSVSVFGEGKITVPADFKRVEPKSRIIQHEFQAKAGEGDDVKTARVTMMAAGGDVKANIQRWQGQFAGGDQDARKTEEMKVGKWQVYVVDVNGNYAERVGGPFAGGKVVNRENYAMVGVILEDPNGRKFFLKMIGPAEVVKANRKAFVGMAKGIDK
ncbi:MAG: hypothetical protein ACR2OA_17520 [Rubripirellula sp.]|jgi:hypothetical protein